MSNMKNLLGDSDFGELEEVFGSDTTTFTEQDKERVIELWEKTGGNIYDYWMEENGRAYAKAWITTHGGFIDEAYIKAFTRDMTKTFVDWMWGLR